METLLFPEIFSPGVKAFFTGRTPGIDLGRISEISTIAVQNIYMPVQQHTDTVIVLGSDLGPKVGDAVVTRREGLLLGIKTADCVPILLYDKVSQVVGAVHAGWKGTAAGILKKTVRTVSERFSSSPSDIVIAIGPCIRQCCYEVGCEVVEAVTKTTGDGTSVIRKGGKYFLDLQAANKYQALHTGIPEENIWIAGCCTCCLPDKYFSYRFAKDTTGRQGGFIGIIG